MNSWIMRYVECNVGCTSCATTTTCNPSGCTSGYYFDSVSSTCKCKYTTYAFLLCYKTRFVWVAEQYQTVSLSLFYSACGSNCNMCTSNVLCQLSGCAESFYAFATTTCPCKTMCKFYQELLSIANCKYLDKQTAGVCGALRLPR